MGHGTVSTIERYLRDYRAKEAWPDSSVLDTLGRDNANGDAVVVAARGAVRSSIHATRRPGKERTSSPLPGPLSHVGERRAAYARLRRSGVSVSQPRRRLHLAAHDTTIVQQRQPPHGGDAHHERPQHELPSRQVQ